MSPSSSCKRVPSFIIGDYPIDDDQTVLTLPVELRGGGANLVLDDANENNVVLPPAPTTRRADHEYRRPLLRPSVSSAHLTKQKPLDASSRCHSDQILVDTECLVDLKMQLASQREKIDILSSKLNLCQVENEALKAENDELQEAYVEDHYSSDNHVTATPLDQSASSEQTGGWLSRSLRRVVDHSTVSSANNDSKLVKENARLHMSVENIRKSFHNYINLSRRNSHKDMVAMAKLQRENEELRRQLEQQKSKVDNNISSPIMSGSSPRHAFKDTPQSPSEYTVKTSNESDDVLAPLEDQDVAFTARHSSTNFLQMPFQGGMLSGADAWTIEGVDIEA